jgi:hypothetical protein
MSTEKETTFCTHKGYNTVAPCDDSCFSQHSQSESIEWKEALYSFIKKWVPGSYAHLSDNDENDGERLRTAIQDAITTAVETKEKSVIEILERHASWKPTEGHGSEEELGFQKGLMAEAKLIKSEILSIINPSKE